MSCGTTSTFLGTHLIGLFSGLSVQLLNFCTFFFCFFRNIKFNYCILDEGHVIKNGKTKLSKAIKQLAANFRVILSGTPIQVKRRPGHGHSLAVQSFNVVTCLPPEQCPGALVVV